MSVRVLVTRGRCCTLREKCPYSELFCSVFSRIRIESGEILCISPYSVRMRENTDQNNSEYRHFSAVLVCLLLNLNKYCPQFIAFQKYIKINVKNLQTKVKTAMATLAIFIMMTVKIVIRSNFSFTLIFLYSDKLYKMPQFHLILWCRNSEETAQLTLLVQNQP